MGVFFLNENEGWLVGSDGSVFHTTNGGADWQKQDSRIPLINGHVRDTINGIDFVNSENGIAVADVGFIIHTSDGGENWQLCDNITENNLTSIQFITDQIAYA